MKKNVDELIKKCMESKQVKRSIDKLVVEYLFTPCGEDADKIQAAIDALQERIDARKK